MATTQWSRVLAARDGSDTEARSALEALCGTYWEPLYAFVRRQGAAADEAADLTQGYFTELLDKDFLAGVDPAKGRFRSFLLASLKHFLSHERERARAVKRGGRAQTVSLDVEGAEQRYGLQADQGMTPEEAFQYRWAVTMLNRALGRLRQDSLDSGREAEFDHLKPYLVGAGGEAPYAETAQQLDKSEAAVKMAVSRLRRRFGQCLRAEVADTVAKSDDVEDEVRHLVATLRAHKGMV